MQLVEQYGEYIIFHFSMVTLFLLYWCAVEFGEKIGEKIGSKKKTEKEV